MNKAAESGSQSTKSVWDLHTDGNNIAWLSLDTGGSMNVLSQSVFAGLDNALTQLQASQPDGLIIYSRKDSGFIAGADVKEFPELAAASDSVDRILSGHAIMAKLESLPCPTVAVLNGAALGGGLELALSCDWRIAYAGDKKTLGLPEVKVGVHPGLGGTVRAPRLIGVRAAMELMLTGKSIRPSKARSIGLVDKLTDAIDWRSHAVRLARKKRKGYRVNVIDRILAWAPVRPLLANVLRKQVRAKANPDHYPAPYAVIDLWQQHGGSSNPGSYRAEALSFAGLLKTETAQNLVRVFFLQDRLKELAKNSERTFQRAHVIGAGTMGADIAAWCALRGLEVTLQDREQKYVDAGLEKARASLKRKLRRDDAVNETMQNLHGDLSGDGAANADVVIEAIFENLEAKQQLFVDLEQKVSASTLLASNTSSIPLEQIAEPLQDSSRLIGLHFFNPVALMPLVEVVSSPETNAECADAGMAFVKQIGKLPLPCKGLPGFLVNRILAPYMDEAFRMYEEGMQPEAIDKVATEFGMPMGPIELADTVGIDILLHVAGIVGPTIGRDLPPGIQQFVDEKRLGQKTGRGFYTWTNGKPVKVDVEQPLDSLAQDRLILAFVNEAAACVADKVVGDADLADGGTIFGTGFAPFRGGPLHYAKSRGIDAVVARMKEFETSFGARFAPSAGLRALADSE